MQLREDDKLIKRRRAGWVTRSYYREKINQLRSVWRAIGMVCGGGLDFVANHGGGGIMYNRRRCSVKTKATMWSKRISKLGGFDTNGSSRPAACHEGVGSTTISFVMSHPADQPHSCR